MGKLSSNLPDTTDPVGAKLKRAVDWVERGLNDRWPCRGQANVPTREYRPLDDVSREGRPAKYRKYPAA